LWIAIVSEFSESAVFKRRLVNRHLEAGRWSDAGDILAELEKLSDDLAPSIDATPEGAAAQMELYLSQGLYYRCIYNAQRAAETYGASIALGEKLLQDYPAFYWGHECLVDSYRGIGDVFLTTGNAAQAESVLAAALGDTSRPQLSLSNYDNPIQLAKTRFQLACLWWWNGRRTIATAGFRQSITEARKSGKPGTSRSFDELLATFLSICPDETCREPDRAAELAMKSLRHDDGLSHQLLGIAQYRAGQTAEANKSLQRSCDLRSGGDAFEWFYLAMAYGALGDTQLANHWLQ
jgi:hypothetical protein